MTMIRVFNNAAKTVLLAGTFCGAVATSALTIPNVPLTVQQSVKPMVMLVAGKDHRFFYEAYNDASDVDGDGTLDIRFKPTITYLGLFQSDLCYSHNNLADGTGVFTPVGNASTLNVCEGITTGTGKRQTVGGEWSGNWLNYVTTSRIDALRVVLYGGMRELDDDTGTILRRAYIPQDAHSWAKEYTSVTVDKYNIADYTPLSAPASGKRHFFGNLTPNATTNCATLNNCSESLHPWLSVVTNSPKRVWEWASTERPVLTGNAGGTRTDRTVRVKVCTAGFHDGCKGYPNGNWKPVGILHDYGETDQMYFGLLTGSYDKSMSGGRLRKVVTSFKDEVDSNSGVFASVNGIVTTFNKLRIRDFNNTRTDSAYKGGWVTTRPPNNGEFPDWGNPIGEMMYEATRYFAGKGAPTTAYAGTTTVDDELGLPKPSWDDPYSSTSAAKAPFCARGNMLTISDVNVSYDSDELPGVNSNFTASPAFSSDLTGLDVSTVATTISANENIAGKYFIGQVTNNFDSAPTAKAVDDLGKIRGLAPEEPTKRGSYYAASVAHWAKTNDLRSDKKGEQTLDTFVVALASPLPQIKVTLPNTKVITMVPFAKSVSGSSINGAKGQYQPTNQIVDFYVEQIANSGPDDADSTVNGGRYQAKFRINFEDVEQGADHDMDAIVNYVVTANADSTLKVELTPQYQAGGIQHRMGYVVSGTTRDGVYLVVQDEDDQASYFLNVPDTAGAKPGDCDVASPPSGCTRLPYLRADGVTTQTSSKTFTPAATGEAATLLEGPLWYAAKWGGFLDKNANKKPDLQGEWDLDGDGVPDTYFLVQNPLKLKESLKKTLDNIAARSSSASNISANSTSISSTSRLYQAIFNTQRWSGDLIAYPAIASGVGATPAWEASQKLPTWTNRKIFMRTSSGGATPTLSTVRMTDYTTLSAADQTVLGNAATFDYLRGDRSNELLKGGVLRDREHALGDIVQSSPSYEKLENTVYVGANDGALHAFDGGTGAELFAFIPRSSVARLKDLASVAYTHEYFVDGDVQVPNRTALTNNKSWAFTLLGRGGKGLFALDVTDPNAFVASNFMWEYTPAADATALADADLGYMLGRSALVKLNNGKAGLIVGNGYNSTGKKAVLYIFILNTDGSINTVKKLDTGSTGVTGGDNGLAAPLAVDTNNDGTADVVYAGDLYGNVWKFDISNTDPTLWNLPTATKPLFTALDSLGNAQPITAPLFTALNDVGGDPNFGERFIFFGTGAYFRTGDPSDFKVQTWYGIIDNGTAVTGRTQLKQRTVNQTGTFAGRLVRTFGPATSGDMSGKKGWYLDMTTPSAGERMVTISRIIEFAVPALMASSLFPVPSDPCVPGGYGYLNFLNPFTGGGLTTGVLDVDHNGNFQDDKITIDGAPSGTTQPIGSVDLAIGIPTEPITLAKPGGGVNIYIGGSGPTDRTDPTDPNNPPPTPRDPNCPVETLFCGSGNGNNSVVKGRISWREIVRD